MATEIIRINAGDLNDALIDAYPRRKKKHKPTPVSMEYDKAGSKLSIIEAKHGFFQNDVSVSGKWSEIIQVDGVVLAKVVAAYSAEVELELIAETDHLVVRHDKSISRVLRIDGSTGKVIKRKPQESNPLHQGMPKGADAPLIHNVDQRQTWAFSANMGKSGSDKNTPEK